MRRTSRKSSVFVSASLSQTGAVEGAEAVLGVGVEDDVARRVQVPPARGVAQGDSRGVAEVDLALEEGRVVVGGAETFGDVGDDAGVSRERFVRVDVTLPYDIGRDVDTAGEKLQVTLRERRGSGQSTRLGSKRERSPSRNHPIVTSISKTD